MQDHQFEEDHPQLLREVPIVREVLTAETIVLLPLEDAHRHLHIETRVAHLLEHLVVILVAHLHMFTQVVWQQYNRQLELDLHLCLASDHLPPSFLSGAEILRTQ